MILLFLILVALVLGELLLQWIVRRSRRDFKWLITEADEEPDLDREGLNKFLQDGFDRDLGWSRKPNSTGHEKGRDRTVQFSIDALGSRTLPRKHPNDPTIAAFGDSYTFCRQVENDETWEAYLSEKLAAPVLNFGAGNYGVDQAILQYERTDLPASVQTILLGFVPETICRVQSYWKHYLEFGNTFAFKPRFVFERGNLRLLPNLMRSAADFEGYRSRLKELQAGDRFYEEKFRRVQFRFPYLLSFGRAPKRHICLLYRLCVRAFSRCLGKASILAENAPLEWIMEGNIRDAHRLYSDQQSRELLTAILERFVSIAKCRGHKPVVLVLPQMMDISIAGDEKKCYRSYFEELGKRMSVIDLTEEIRRQNDLQALYTEDSYGGHFSPLGNRVVAEFLCEAIDQ